MTFIRRIVATLVTAVIIFLGLVVAENSGNFLVLLLMLLVSVVFWVVELNFHPGTTIYAFRYFLIRILTSLGIVSAGALFIHLGVSELSAPVSLSRYRLLVQAIRVLVGSEGLAALLIVLGTLTLVVGVRMFPGVLRLQRK